MAYSSRLGGSIASELGFFTFDEVQGVSGIAIDRAGNAWITGYTIMTGSGNGLDYPRTENGFQGTPAPSCGRCYRASTFVTKLNSTGSSLDYSGVLGDGYGQGVAVGADEMSGLQG